MFAGLALLLCQHDHGHALDHNHACPGRRSRANGTFDTGASSVLHGRNLEQLCH